MFTGTGEKAWGVPLSSAILRTALLLRSGATPRLAAGCKDGKVFLLDAHGRRVAYFDCEAQLQDLIVADCDGDGVSEIVVVTANPHRLYAIVAR